MRQRLNLYPIILLFLILFMAQASFGRTEFADTETGNQQSRPVPSDIQNLFDNDVKLANCLVKKGKGCVEKCTLSRTECENHANGLKKLKKEDLEALSKKANQKIALNDIEIKIRNCQSACNICMLGLVYTCKALCYVHLTPVCR